MDRQYRLDADDIKMLRAQGEDRIDNLSDQLLRELRGNMFMYLRDGYSREEIAEITNSNPNVVRLLLDTKAPPE
jgi:DNA-directed RNA polymerase specialized sigma24 family protein